MSELVHAALTRFEIYQAWRAACDTCSMLRDALFGRGSVAAAASAYADLGERLADVRGRLVPEAAALISPLDPAPRVLDRAALEGLERIMHELGTIVIDTAPLRLAFTPLRVPLPVEQRLLASALMLDARLELGDRIDIQQLAADAGVGLDDARRAVCQWLDEGLIYMPRSKPGPLGPEGVTLRDPARARAERWDEYVASRESASPRT